MICRSINVDRLVKLGKEAFLHNDASNPKAAALIEGELGAVFDLSKEGVKSWDVALAVPVWMTGGIYAKLDGTRIDPLRELAKRKVPNERGERLLEPYILASSGAALETVIDLLSNAEHHTERSREIPGTSAS